MKRYIVASTSEHQFKGYWSEEDKNLWESIDWKARNYEEYPVEDDTFTGSIIYYTDNGPVTNNGVTFVKVIRSNPIYAPYYRPDDLDMYEHPMNIDKTFIGPMYDGDMHGKYPVHDRYESQSIYDALSD